MQYFKNLKSPGDIKAEYRRLALKNHPDMGGDTVTMQEINAQYLTALKSIDGMTINYVDHDTKENVEYVYNYRETNEQAVIDIIDKLIGLQMVDVDIYIVGVWVWVSGETKPHKDHLKALKLRWHSKRMKWYFKPYQGRTHYSNKSFDSLLYAYGGGKVPERQDKVLSA